MNKTSAHADTFQFLSLRIKLEVGILLKFATSVSLCATRQNPEASEGSEGEKIQTEPVCSLKKKKNNQKEKNKEFQGVKKPIFTGAFA